VANKRSALSLRSSKRSTIWTATRQRSGSRRSCQWWKQEPVNSSLAASEMVRGSAGADGRVRSRARDRAGLRSGPRLRHRVPAGCAARGPRFEVVLPLRAAERSGPASDPPLSASPNRSRRANASSNSGERTGSRGGQLPGRVRPQALEHDPGAVVDQGLGVVPAAEAGFYPPPRPQVTKRLRLFRDPARVACAHRWLAPTLHTGFTCPCPPARPARTIPA
jgi:hypothetical protein